MFTLYATRAQFALLIDAKITMLTDVARDFKQATSAAKPITVKCPYCHLQ